MGNSRWCPTRSGLAVGRYWYGHRSAAGAQILLLGNSQSCCGGYRGLRDWCSEGGAVERTSKACLSSAICSSPCIWHPWVLLSPWSPPLPLKLVGKALVIVCAWAGEEAVGWAGHGEGCNRKGGGVWVFYSAAVHSQFQPGALQLSPWLRIAFWLLMGHLHLPCKVQ